MPTQKILISNCPCCSGSGSSGSASGSGLPDGLCVFFDQICPDISLDFQTFLKATVTLDFSNCVGTPIGSCASGSLQTGVVDGSEGSAGSCRSTCPSCCDLIPETFEFDLVCFDDSSTGQSYLMSKDLWSLYAGDTRCLFGDALIEPDGCLGIRSDRCAWFILSTNVGRTSITSAEVVLPVDYGNIYGVAFADDNLGYPCSSSISLDSCEPLQISGNMIAGLTYGVGAEYLPCLRPCLFPEGDIANLPGGDFESRMCCVSMTFTITEALP